MPVEPTPAADRVLARIEAHPLGCWIFTGARNARGYGVVQLGRGVGTAKAHRVVYEDMVGRIPDGLTIDHLCLNPSCVNPAHLEPVTRAENTVRQWRAGRVNGGAKQRATTHCPAGHPYDEENTRRYAGRRHCRACARKSARRAYRQRSATS